MHVPWRGFFLLAALLAGGCTPSVEDGVASPALEWRFDIQSDDHDQLSGTVWLSVNGRVVCVDSNATTAYWTLERSGFASHDIPDSALSACCSWWGGYGTECYVIREADGLAIYFRELEEQSDIPGFRRIQIVRAP